MIISDAASCGVIYDHHYDIYDHNLFLVKASEEARKNKTHSSCIKTKTANLKVENLARTT
jgi:hypothetical protein